MTIKQLTAQLKKRMDVIAKERDKLRDLESEVSQLADNCDDALASLENAVDRLSELA